MSDSVAFDFLDTLFRKSGSVRVGAQEGTTVYRLSEGKTSGLSHVDIDVPNGFVIRFDDHFEYSASLFEADASNGFRRKCDFFIVSLADGVPEIFILEMKSSHYDAESARKQLLSGVAFMAFCVQLGIDRLKAAEAMGRIRMYAVLLTNTTVSRTPTNPEVIRACSRFRSVCDCVPGIFCVNGQCCTLEELRRQGEAVSLLDKVHLSKPFPAAFYERVSGSNRFAVRADLLG